METNHAVNPFWRWRHMAAVVSLALLSVQAFAGDRFWPGIIGADDRQVAESTDAPWRAVGRLNNARYRKLGFCTATLIAPDAIATAAHCFFDPQTHQRLPAETFRFVLALKRDEYLEIGNLKCVHINPAFDPARKRTVQDLHADTAVGMLSQPMKETPVPLASGAVLRKGARVTHAGYGRDRPFLLSVHRDCTVLSADGSSALTDCDTNFGQSGGPVFTQVESTYELAGVMSGFAEGKATGVATSAGIRKAMQDTDCK